MNKSRWLDACWLIACLCLSSIWCLTAARQLSATFDEPLYIERGLECWRSGSHAGLMKLGTMPLAIDFNTLPLYAYERSTGQPIDPVRDLDRVLPWARAAALAFWWLLLVYGWLAARAMLGRWAARLTVAWLACEPNLLAHASLATTDLAIAACLLAMVYHFQVGRERQRWRWRVGLPGLWFGAALLAKASGMVFGPLCLLAVEVPRWYRKSVGESGTGLGFFRTCRATVGLPNADDVSRAMPTAAWSAARASLRELTQIALIGFAVMFVYCGCDWRAEPSFVAWAHKLPAGPGHDALVWLSENLRIFSNAGEGLVRQVKHNMRGHHGSYLLGRAYDRPVWFYFPAALSMKLALPLLFAPLAVGLAGRRKALNWALAAALVLFLFSFNCRVQIGIRLVLPLIAFLVVGVSTAIVAVIQQSSPRARVGWISAAAAAVLWTGAASWRVWPEGLCYTNELWGGTSQGYLCLSDSNYDWGQGLKELAANAPHSSAPLDVWYFGSDPAVNAAPLRQLPLHVLPIAEPADVPRWIPGRYLAVSTTLLFGTPIDLPGYRHASAYLRAREPVARTSTFLIYDLGQAAVAASAAARPQR